MDIFENINESFEMFRDMVREIPDRYHSNNKEITKLQEETQDLLHMIEMVNFNARDGYKLSKALKEVRKRRRELKDENQLLEPIVPLLKKYRNELNNMDKILGEIRKRERLQDVRGYRCRVRDDLQESLNKGKVIGF